MSYRDEDQHVSALLIDPKKYSDLKLVCNGEVFHVHKAILCTQSSVIAAACDGDFLEAATNIINIESFDAETVERMVSFLYKKEYDDSAKRDRGPEGTSLYEFRARHPTKKEAHPMLELIQYETETEELSTHTTARDVHIDEPTLEMIVEVLHHNVHVNAIADYYDIQPLRDLSNQKIKHTLESSWHADGFCDIVEDVFNLTGDVELQNLMSSVAAEHVQELLEHGKFMKLDNLSNFFASVLRNTVALQNHKDVRSTKELEAVKSRLQDVEYNLKAAEMKYTLEESVRESETNRADRIMENIHGCLEVLNRTARCRNTNCEANFTCYIERGGHANEPRYLLRCARCRCRHKEA